MENYRSVSILLINCFPKMYEKYIRGHFKPFINGFLSQYMAPYRVHQFTPCFNKADRTLEKSLLMKN